MATTAAAISALDSAASLLLVGQEGDRATDQQCQAREDPEELGGARSLGVVAGAQHLVPDEYDAGGQERRRDQHAEGRGHDLEPEGVHHRAEREQRGERRKRTRRPRRDRPGVGRHQQDERPVDDHADPAAHHEQRRERQADQEHVRAEAASEACADAEGEAVLRGPSKVREPHPRASTDRPLLSIPRTRRM